MLRAAQEGAGRVGSVFDVRLSAQPVETTVQVSTSSAELPLISQLTITPRRIRRGANCGVDYHVQLHVARDGGVTQS